MGRNARVIWWRGWSRALPHDNGDGDSSGNDNDSENDNNNYN